MKLAPALAWNAVLFVWVDIFEAGLTEGKLEHSIYSTADFGF